MSGPGCHCGIEWKALRTALGLTQKEMGILICRCERTVYEIERPDHHCPDEAVITLARAWMQNELVREKLRAAGYPLD